MCTVLAAVVSGAVAARAWRRSVQEQTAREVGLDAFRRGDWNVAIRNLGALAARKVADPSELLAFATARLQAPLEDGAHVAQAVKAIDAALALGADRSRCDRLRLEAYVEGGMLAEAQREAEAVLARDERDREATRVLVHASVARGRLDEAERILRRAAELEPGLLANRIALAEVLARRAREGSLDRGPDSARAMAVVTEVEAWVNAPDAPAGVGALAQVVALDLGTETREAIAERAAGPEVPARSRDEIELRVRLLDSIGRCRDADRLLGDFFEASYAEIERAQPADEASYRDIARMAFRRAIFAGDVGAARRLLAHEVRRMPEARESKNEPVHEPMHELMFEAVIRIVDGREADACAMEATTEEKSREVLAWFDALRKAHAGLSVGPRAQVRALDVVAEAALRLVEARSALRAGIPQEALRLADDAVLLARGRFDAAESIAIESLAQLDRAEEACERAARLVEATDGRTHALALRLRCESQVLDAKDEAATARYRRPREAVVADARAILASHDASMQDRASAVAVLGAAGDPADAMATFIGFVESTPIPAEELTTLAECAVVLARAFDDVSVLRAVRASIERAPHGASEEARWALAWIDATEAEWSGDEVHGFEVLRTAAGSNRNRLAIAGRFAESRGIAGAAAVLRSSLPEGAAVVVASRAAMEDPMLAADGLRALAASGDVRGSALAHLRLATVHPAHFNADEVLARAVEARRTAPRDVELLAAIAGFLLVTSPPDPAQALALLGDAMRISSLDPRLRQCAAHAALFAGDPQLAREHAEVLPLGSPARKILCGMIALSEGDGRRAESELAGIMDDAGSDVSGSSVGRVRIAALRASALLLTGSVDRIDITSLDPEIVQIARMVPRADHRALLLRYADVGGDATILAHLSAEYLHRALDTEVESIARLAATRILDSEALDSEALDSETLDSEALSSKDLDSETPDSGVPNAGNRPAVIAAFRAAAACGDDVLASRARKALSVEGDARALAALRREEALALFVRDPGRARAIAEELLRADPEDVESALIAVAGAVTLKQAVSSEVEQLARAPRSPEVYLLEARLALLRGSAADARRAARDGLALAARRTYVAFDTREALRLIVEGDSRSGFERVLENEQTSEDRSRTSG